MLFKKMIHPDLNSKPLLIYLLSDFHHYYIDHMDLEILLPLPIHLEKYVWIVWVKIKTTKSFYGRNQVNETKLIIVEGQKKFPSVNGL